MPEVPRPRRDPTHEWQQIKQYTLWPEQEVYELLRPMLLWGTTPAERAKETGAAERTLRRKASAFDRLGIASLFPHEPAPSPDHARRLTPSMRQLLTDLKTAYPGFSLRELATICFVRFGRQPSHHTVKQVLAATPLAPSPHRRFPPCAEITDPFERRQAVVQLNAEGWSVTSIAAYPHTRRARVYEVLQRWISEGWAGREDRSRAPKAPARKVTFEAITQVRKLASNQALGAIRVLAALEQLGISLSQTTCGRLLALNRALYGLDTPRSRTPKQRREMPFKARFRHEWWSVDVRYIEDHCLPDHSGPVYQLTILENYSRCVLAE